MNGLTTVELKAAEGSSLTFSLTRRVPPDVDFVVTVKTSWLSASADASTYLSGPPSALFRDMADNWRGWAGQKNWVDLEHRVALIASADSTGHITLRVHLRAPNYSDRASLSLNFEAGGLGALSASVVALFEPNVT